MQTTRYPAWVIERCEEIIAANEMKVVRTARDGRNWHTKLYKGVYKGEFMYFGVDEWRILRPLHFFPNFACEFDMFTSVGEISVWGEFHSRAAERGDLQIEGLEHTIKRRSI